MSVPFCTFVCINNTGHYLDVGNPEISHGTHLAVQTSRIQPNGVATEVGVTKGSGGAGSEGVITFQNDAIEGHWGVKWDNPVVGGASTPIQSPPPGGSIGVELNNDVWTITCTYPASSE